jgi:tRNA(His) 5'-end guanylyltransferase
MGDNLGDRMKLYEDVYRLNLPPKIPVLCRIDGKSFSTFTRDLGKPWDSGFITCMQETAKYLCENIQGCKIAYVQSDEITLLLTDFETEKTQGWFNYNLQKMSSVGASFATAKFLQQVSELLPNKKDYLPNFDARFWSLSKDEVVNCFIWRQQDCIRNSVQSLARAHFSHNMCNNKNNEQLKNMLLDNGISWEEQPNHCKYGACIVNVTNLKEVSYAIKGEAHKAIVDRSEWVVDMDIPEFKNNKQYINRLL